MREIKFRGIRVKTGEMVTGYLIEREYPFLHDIIQPIGENSSVQFSVARDSVGQFTGLLDVDREEIYEGDIIESIPINPGEEYIKGEVVFLEGGFWIDDGTTAIPVFQEIMELRIIGNIFKNPELLNQVSDEENTKKIKKEKLIGDVKE